MLFTRFRFGVAVSVPACVVVVKEESDVFCCPSVRNGWGAAACALPERGSLPIGQSSPACKYPIEHFNAGAALCKLNESRHLQHPATPHFHAGQTSLRDESRDCALTHSKEMRCVIDCY